MGESEMEDVKEQEENTFCSDVMKGSRPHQNQWTTRHCFGCMVRRVTACCGGA